jgi:hypothetical protein
MIVTSLPSSPSIGFKPFRASLDAHGARKTRLEVETSLEKLVSETALEDDGIAQRELTVS